MTRLFKLTASFVLLFFFTCAAAKETSENDKPITQPHEYQLIAQTIQNYFDGTQSGNPDLVKKAFKDTLFIQWIDKNGEFRSRSASSYIGRIKAGETVPRYGRIVSMDVTNNGASAKLEIRWGERTITDYILLLKIDGQWKITNKIATF